MGSADQDPTNAELLTAMQAMWGQQQKSLIEGVETRLRERLDDGLTGLEAKIERTSQHLREELAQEIHDRPVVVHVDMGRVRELEQQVAEISQRLAELDERTRS